MKAENIRELINCSDLKFDKIAWNEMRPRVIDELTELERKAKLYDDNEKYIEIGKAVDKAINEGYTLLKVVDIDVVDVRYEDSIEVEVYREINDLLKWKGDTNID